MPGRLYRSAVNSGSCNLTPVLKPGGAAKTALRILSLAIWVLRVWLDTVPFFSSVMLPLDSLYRVETDFVAVSAFTIRSGLLSNCLETVCWWLDRWQTQNIFANELEVFQFAMAIRKFQNVLLTCHIIFFPFKTLYNSIKPVFLISARSHISVRNSIHSRCTDVNNGPHNET